MQDLKELHQFIMTLTAIYFTIITIALSNNLSVNHDQSSSINESFLALRNYSDKLFHRLIIANMMFVLIPMLFSATYYISIYFNSERIGRLFFCFSGLSLCGVEIWHRIVLMKAHRNEKKQEIPHRLKYDFDEIKAIYSKAKFRQIRILVGFYVFPIFLRYFFIYTFCVFILDIMCSKTRTQGDFLIADFYLLNYQSVWPLSLAILFIFLSGLFLLYDILTAGSSWTIFIADHTTQSKLANWHKTKTEQINNYRQFLLCYSKPTQTGDIKKSLANYNSPSIHKILFEIETALNVEDAITNESNNRWKKLYKIISENVAQKKETEIEAQILLSYEDVQGGLKDIEIINKMVDDFPMILKRNFQINQICRTYRNVKF